MLKLKIIVGSTRPDRFSEKLLPWIKENMTENFDWEILDLRDYPMPFYDQPISPSMVKDENYGNEAVKKWAQKIKEADAFLVIAPEYNRGPSAVLKNALDSVYAEWNKKAIGFIAYGSVGGARSVEHLRLSAIELQMAPIRLGVHIPEPWNLLDDNGNLKSGALDSFTHSLKAALDQLNWWGEALKSARNEES